MTYKENITAILECYFTGFKKEIIDSACNRILEQEPKTGHWIFDDECNEHGHCSHCGYGKVDFMDGEPHNFCRNCGCRMVEPQESEISNIRGEELRGRK